MLPLEEISYMSEFGEIKPGDDVVVVTSGYSHCIHIKKGKYLGINSSGNIRCSIPTTRNQYFEIGTDKKVDWRFPKEQREIRKIHYDRITTLFANNIIPVKL